MGGVLSRASRIFGGVIHDKPDKSDEKDDIMSRYQVVKKLKNLSSLGSNEQVRSNIEVAVPDTKRSSIGSDDTESLTPNFERQYNRLADIPDSIYSAATEKLDKNFQEFHNRADINDNWLGSIWNQCEISQFNVFSTSSPSDDSTRVSTQENVGINNRRANFMRNTLKNTSPRQPKSQSCPSSPTFNFHRKTSKEQQNVPIFDIVDDFSPLATPNISQFELPMLSDLQSSNFTQAKIITNKYSQENDKTEVVVEEPKQILIKNKLNRKRKSDRRGITSTEDNEINVPAIIDFQQEKIRPGDGMTNTKWRLTPFYPRGSEKTIDIIDLSQEDERVEEPSVVIKKNPDEKPASQVKLSTMTINNSWDVETTAESSLDVVGDDRKHNTWEELTAEGSTIISSDPTKKCGDAFSPDIASPEKKRRRLSSQFLQVLNIKECRSTSSCTLGRKKRVQIVDLTQEDETVEESSVVLKNNPEEKPASQLKLSMIASNDARDFETTPESSLDVVGDDWKHNVSEKLTAEKEQAAIDDFCPLATPNISQFELPMLSESQSSSFIEAEVMTKKYLQENDKTEVVVEEPEQILIKNGLNRKRKSDRRGITSTEDNEINVPAIIDFKQDKIRAEDGSTDTKWRSTPFHPRESEKTVDIVDLSQEDETVEESSVVLKNNPEEKPATQLKLSMIASNDAQDVETTPESSLDVVGDDWKHNVSEKLTAEKEQAAIDDFSPLATPNISQFELPMLSESQSSSFIEAEVMTKKYLQENDKTEVVVEEPEQSLIKNGLNRKRKSDRRGITSTEDNEINVPAIIDFKQDKIRAEDGPTDTKWRSTPFHPRESEKTVDIVDLSQEDETVEESSVVLKNNPEEKPATQLKLSMIASNDTRDVETTPESSLDVVGDDWKHNVSEKLTADKEQSAIDYFSPLATPNISQFESPMLLESQSSSFIEEEVMTKKYLQKNDKTEIVVEEPEQILIKNGLNRTSDSRAITNTEDKENVSPIINFQQEKFRSKDGPKDKKWRSTPFHPRESEKTVDIVDLTQEDETVEKSSVVLKNNPERKSASEVKLSTIASNKDASQKLMVDEKQYATVVNDVLDVRTAAESSSDESGDDRDLNGLQKSMFGENSSSTVINYNLVVEASPESPLDATSNDSKTLAEWTVFSPTDGDECSPESATTNFTQSSSFISSLLSDRCSEYDQSLRDGNLQYCNFTAGFDVGIEVIHKQIDDILTFLETDIAAD